MAVLIPDILRRRGAILAAVVLVGASLQGAGAQTGRAAASSSPRAGDVTRADARRMREKVLAIEAHALLLARPRARGTPIPPARTTVVSEREVNSYLAFDPTAQIPPGMTQPRIGLLGNRRVTGSAVLDLDAVRVRHGSGGWFDPVSYLSGRLPVVVSGRLTAASGWARFDLESATVSGIPIPRALIQEIISYYSRTAASPSGLSLDDEFVLPAGIRQIELRVGEAVLLQ